MLIFHSCHPGSNRLAGSGKGALTQIIRHRPDLFVTRSIDDSSIATYSAYDIYSFIR